MTALGKARVMHSLYALPAPVPLLVCCGQLRQRPRTALCFVLTHTWLCPTAVYRLQSAACMAPFNDGSAALLLLCIRGSGRRVLAGDRGVGLMCSQTDSSPCAAHQPHSM